MLLFENKIMVEEKSILFYFLQLVFCYLIYCEYFNITT